jgi:hypothetical protein
VCDVFDEDTLALFVRSVLLVLQSFHTSIGYALGVKAQDQDRHSYETVFGDVRVRSTDFNASCRLDDLVFSIVESEQIPSRAH